MGRIRLNDHHRDVRSCPWWRPLSIAVIGDDLSSRTLVDYKDRLLASFVGHGHRVVSATSTGVDLLIATAVVPSGPEHLDDRIPERSQPLALGVMRDYGLPERPDNLVVLVSVDEPMRGRAHLDIVQSARVAMARIGAPKVVFVSGDGPDEVTYCTLEGGHPTETVNLVDGLRDRLVASATAREVGGRFDIVADGLSPDDWESTTTPDEIVRAGRRMDELGLLPPPQKISDYVSPAMARRYEWYLGLKGFSEGMLFAVDPLTRTTMVTASGSWDVDKRALHREEVAVLGGMVGRRVQVLAPPAVRPKGPSVEAAEVLALLAAVPTVRLSPAGPDGWALDPSGPVEVPIVRAGIHAHVGVTRADATVVESVEPDRDTYPFGFGCGTDLMCEVVQDTVARSDAINKPDDPRLYVRWPMLYHGEMVLELWKPGGGARSFDGLLDLFDPTRTGAISHTPDHIDQPV